MGGVGGGGPPPFFDTTAALVSASSGVKNHPALQRRPYISNENFLAVYFDRRHKGRALIPFFRQRPLDEMQKRHAARGPP